MVKMQEALDTKSHHISIIITINGFFKSVNCDYSTN